MSRTAKENVLTQFLTLCSAVIDSPQANEALETLVPSTTIEGDLSVLRQRGLLNEGPEGDVVAARARTLVEVYLTKFRDTDFDPFLRYLEGQAPRPSQDFEEVDLPRDLLENLYYSLHQTDEDIQLAQQIASPEEIRAFQQSLER